MAMHFLNTVNFGRLGRRGMSRQIKINPFPYDSERVLTAHQSFLSRLPLAESNPPLFALPKNRFRDHMA